MQPVLNKETILHLLSGQRAQLKSYGVSQIGLFGSYVRNSATESSDIDLLVDIAREKKTLTNFLNLSDHLEKLFGCKVDLVTLQSLSPYIGPHILKEVSYARLAD